MRLVRATPVELTIRTALWSIRRGLWHRRRLIVRIALCVVMSGAFGTTLALIVEAATWDCWTSPSKATLLRAQQFVEADTEWSMNNDADCPANLRELVKYMNSKETLDAWGSPLLIACGASGAAGVPFGVVSAGADKMFGTVDDIRSWEPRRHRPSGADPE